MRAALLIFLLFLAVPAVGAETGAGEAESQATVETIPGLDEETLEILKMRELLEMMELLENMDILARMEDEE